MALNPFLSTTSLFHCLSNAERTASQKEKLKQTAVIRYMNYNKKCLVEEE